MEDHHMTGAEWTLTRFYARQAVKRDLLGLKLSHIEASEITKAANQYIEDHPEIIEQARSTLISWKNERSSNSSAERRKDLHGQSSIAR
jgi:hypothetical protein